MPKNVVTWERWLLTRVFKYSHLTDHEKMTTQERWSLLKGGEVLTRGFIYSFTVIELSNESNLES